VRALPERDRIALRRWLFASIVAVFLAVAVGGITRLTESGLSITEWKPVSGVLPPMTDAAWADAFAEFRKIPQAQTTHRDISLSGFKLIYWWEWFHRIVARGVGLVFAIPYLWFMVQGRIPSRLRMRLALLPLLTLGQGALGWYMVQSGLVERSSVSAYRLTAHLALALGILAVAVWTYSELRPAASARAVTGLDADAGAVAARDVSDRAPTAWRWALRVMTMLLGTTLLSGGFVAGLRAGQIFNEFPLMGGQIVPPGYSQLGAWWVNAFENPAAAQFHHRVLAIVSTIVALVLVWRVLRAPVSALVRRGVLSLGAVVSVQLLLGVITLLLAVPVALGALHQFTGVLALTAALVVTQRAGGVVWGTDARLSSRVVDRSPSRGEHVAPGQATASV
jgi:cytochrome c oxidase assembly protein subunit 15